MSTEHRQLVETLRQMRTAQQEYFRRRTSPTLQESRDAEAIARGMIGPICRQPHLHPPETVALAKAARDTAAAQTRYFRTRHPADLDEAKRHEKTLDQMLNTPAAPRQFELFKDEDLNA